MANRWFGGALLVGCLMTGAAARAQYLPAPGHGPMSEPMPVSSSACPPVVEGPIKPFMAPPGPNSWCDLPADLPGAFDECPPLCKGCGTFWASAEYLHWWFKSSRTPPLITLGAITDPLPGAIGQPGTQVVFPASTEVFPSFGVLGGSEAYGTIDDGGDRSGGRFTAGFWLNPGETFGIEASYFLVGSRDFSFGGGPLGVQGSPIIARPVFDLFIPTAPFENAYYISFPNPGNGEEVIGSFNIAISNRLWGADARTVCTLFLADCWRLDLLFGGRFLQLDEDLDISQSVIDVNGAFTGAPSGTTAFLTVPPGPGPGFAGGPFLGQNVPGTNFLLNDRFQTRNRFWGGGPGFRAEWRCCRLFANVQGKVDLGTIRQQVEINGRSQVTLPGLDPQTFVGGLLALPSNIGLFARSRFSVAPSLDVNVGYWICPWLRGWVGYSLLHITSVVRPGEQIDRVINSSQSPVLAGPVQFQGPVRPLFLFNETDFWAQGVNLGLEIRF
jgi:hypothetical protein